jgi:DNA-binding XRE family transcriptional regulator
MFIIPPFPIVQSHGQVTHVMVPLEEYARLAAAAGELPDAAPSSAAMAPDDDEISRAAAILDNPETRWHGADELMWQVVQDGLAPARKQAGLSQQELADQLGLSQAQVSRMEKNADSITLRVLRRIAEVLSASRDGKPS